MKQMLVQKERDFIETLCDMGDWWTLLSKTVSSFCRGKSPAVLSKAKTKASVQSSCSILKYSQQEVL